MPSSSAQISSQFNRKPKNISASFSEEQTRNTAETNCNSTHMRPQEEPKKIPNGSFARRERGVRYKECRKNHAANIGGYAVDGCREFMASGEEGTSAALKCAACSCHRNFHKKEVENDWPSDSSDSTSRK